MGGSSGSVHVWPSQGEQRRWVCTDAAEMLWKNGLAMCKSQGPAKQTRHWALKVWGEGGERKAQRGLTTWPRHPCPKNRVRAMWGGGGLLGGAR